MDAPEPSSSLSPHQGFTVDKSFGKNLSQQEHANRVNRIVSTYMSSTPEQQHAGNTWYRQAHRAAVTVAKGEDPGIGANTKAMKRGVYRPPGLTDDAVDRASGAIARLSPSLPAGMDWTHNAQAAHEVSKLSESQVSDINKDSSKRYVPGTQSLKHAGGAAIVHAHAILTGKVTPEQDLNTKQGKPDRQKIGTFYHNIKSAGRSNEVTVDARSAGITVGKRIGFQDVQPQVGKLSGQRYRDFESAHQDATEIINQHLAQQGKTAKLTPPQVQATTWLADKSQYDKQINPTPYAHLHTKNAAGKPTSYRDFPTPAGQEKTQSAHPE
jgi:hypothetical protein